MRATPLAQPPKNIKPAGEPEPETKARSVVRENQEDKEGEKSIIGIWTALLILYFAWDYFVLKNKKIDENLDPANIRANLYNMTFIGLAAVLFINGFKVLLVKVGSFEIPIISKLAKRLLPLFQL